MLITYSNVAIRKFPSQKFWLVVKLVSAYTITVVSLSINIDVQFLLLSSTI